MSTEEDPVTQPEPTAHALSERGEALMAEIVSMFDEFYKKDQARQAAARRERARQRATEHQPVSDQEPAGQ